MPCVLVHAAGWPAVLVLAACVCCARAPCTTPCNPPNLAHASLAPWVPRIWKHLCTHCDCSPPQAPTAGPTCSGVSQRSKSFDLALIPLNSTELGDDGPAPATRVQGTYIVPVAMVVVKESVTDYVPQHFPTYHFSTRGHRHLGDTYRIG
jgi:hypothetical protein